MRGSMVMDGAADGSARSGTVLPSLTRWGVSSEADLVFRGLAQFGRQEAAQLTDALGLSGQRVRAALDELAAIGAVDRVGDASRGWWRARPVTEVLDRLRRHPPSAARQRIVRRLSTLGELGLNGRLPLGGEHSMRVLRGATRVRTRLADLMAGARSEYLSMQPERVFNPETLRSAAPHDHALLARDVAVWALGVPPTLDQEATTAHTQELTGRGLRYRERTALPTKLVVVDRRVALVPLDPNNPAAGALEVSAPDTVRGLIAVFHREWERGVAPLIGAPGQPLSARERSVVGLLARGLTDPAVAAHLELSVRTVAYTVRGLMDRYGVQNRFQLGLLLGAAGVTIPPASGDDAGSDTDGGTS